MCLSLIPTVKVFGMDATAASDVAVSFRHFRLSLQAAIRLESFRLEPCPRHSPDVLDLPAGGISGGAG